MFLSSGLLMIYRKGFIFWIYCWKFLPLSIHIWHLISFSSEFFIQKNWKYVVYHGTPHANKSCMWHLWRGEHVLYSHAFIMWLRLCCVQALQTSSSLYCTAAWPSLVRNLTCHHCNHYYARTTVRNTYIASTEKVRKTHFSDWWRQSKTVRLLA